MIKEIDGDLIALGKQGDFDVIAHGCNCSFAWNSGIAKQMKMEVPEAFAVDTETVQDDQSKLGTLSHTKLSTPIVANLYTQFEYGNSKVKPVYVEYDALEQALTELKNKFKNKRIGIPKIGAGRAKGDWNKIKSIIEKVFSDQDDDLTIVNFVNDPVTTNNHQISGRIRTPKFKSAKLAKPKRQRYTIDYKTMNTNLQPKGKRICKVCATKKSVRDMISELHGVWTCKDICHEKLYDMVSANHKQIVIDPNIPSNTAQPQNLNTVVATS